MGKYCEVILEEIIREGGRMLKIEDEIERAAEKLPKGYLLKINVERDSAWISLLDGGNNRVDVDDTCDNLGNKIRIAVDVAIGMENYG